MSKLQSGQLIQVQDFEPLPGRADCYKVGRVISATESEVEFLVLSDHWRGEQLTTAAGGLAGNVMRTPAAGCLFRDWPSRIQVL